MEFSLRGRWCEQMIENEMLPNLSAADVACCAELSFSCILACSETVDLWQAERCGREDWQEMGGGLYLEILSVLWLSDRTVRCVRWLYIQVIFKDSFIEPAAHSCQAEEKCQSGFFFFLFVFCLSVKICVRSIWNEKEQFCLSLKIQSDTFTTSSTAGSSDRPIVANINNNQHQQSLTHNHVTKKNRARREKKEIWKR